MGTGTKLAGEGYAKIKGFLGNFRDWTANPLLISHGLGMWALAAHYRVTRDKGWLSDGPGSPLQTMLDAFDWVSVQRRRTMREEGGTQVAHWGLLPPASAHDWLAARRSSTMRFVSTEWRRSYACSRRSTIRARRRCSGN